MISVQLRVKKLSRALQQTERGGLRGGRGRPHVQNATKPKFSEQQQRALATNTTSRPLSRRGEEQKL